MLCLFLCLITVGNDLSQLLVSVILSYYAGRGHRPKWMALGMYTVVLFGLLTALPHFLYGAEEEALSLTLEYRGNENASLDAMMKQQRKGLCHNKNATTSECEIESGNYSPQLILFTAQFISGIGRSLYYTLGVSYMDDKIKKSKTPALFNMVKTFKRIVQNPTLMLNNFAAVFYFLGYMPYWIFLPKYIETQYRQSASASNLITGSAGLIFSAIGILLSGLVISKHKPRARYLAAWNVIVGAISVMGIISYAYLGCKWRTEPVSECISHCDCDYIKYNPVCAQDGKTSFISACHADCSSLKTINWSNLFTECSCIKERPSNFGKFDVRGMLVEDGGYAYPGNYQVDCMYHFYIVLVVVCILKFSGATGRASNFLVTVRCVEEKDKPVAMGFGLMLMSLCAFVPSPIPFGIILDNACLVWGKTFTSNVNCWLYNRETLRYTMNFTVATFVLIGTLFDDGVWYFVKDLKIFDEEIELGERHVIRDELGNKRRY